MPHTSFTYDLDFGCDLQEALKFCETVGYTVKSYTEYGPAGGNPNLVIKFNDVLHFMRFLWARYENGPDTDEDMILEEIAMHLPNLPIRAIHPL